MTSPSEVKVCVFDEGHLSPIHNQESITMQTIIGSRLRSWLAYWVCDECGLLYSARIMVDPRIEEERLAEVARNAESQRRFDEQFAKDFGPTFERLAKERKLK